MIGVLYRWRVPAGITVVVISTTVAQAVVAVGVVAVGVGVVVVGRVGGGVVGVVVVVVGGGVGGALSPSKELLLLFQLFLCWLFHCPAKPLLPNLSVPSPVSTTMHDGNVGYDGTNVTYRYCTVLVYRQYRGFYRYSVGVIFWLMCVS